MAAEKSRNDLSARSFICFCNCLSLDHARLTHPSTQMLNELCAQFFVKAKLAVVRDFVTPLFITGTTENTDSLDPILLVDEVNGLGEV